VALWQRVGRDAVLFQTLVEPVRIVVLIVVAAPDALGVLVVFAAARPAAAGARAVARRRGEADRFDEVLGRTPRGLGLDLLVLRDHHQPVQAEDAQLLDRHRVSQDVDAREVEQGLADLALADPVGDLLDRQAQLVKPDIDRVAPLEGRGQQLLMLRLGRRVHDLRARGHGGGEWRVESGEWGVESGEWGVESGELRVGSGG